LSDTAALLERLQRAELFERTGRITDVRGALVEARGPTARVGEQCELRMAGRTLTAEVIGFSAGRTLLMPHGEPSGIAPGTVVTATGRQAEIGVGPQLLGRVVDAFGRPVDGAGPLRAARRRPLRGQPPAAMERRRVGAVLETGVKVIDTCLTLAKGQRIGLFAGSGVGKSSLLAMLARGTASPVKVIALVGERSREVREFVEDQLGPEGLRQAVVVVATASEPAIVRLRAAHAATAIAEHFRDAGQDVLLIMDSLTRFAMARREVGLAAGEPPTARGYTPSVFAELPELCERAGNGAGSSGSITAVYTVLVEGDDLNEPISDAIRGTLDGHVVLSRDIANAGRYPAVDVLRSLSRLRIAVTDTEEQADVRALTALMAVHERNRQLIEVGAYKPGVHAELDRAVAAMPQLERFLGQRLAERVGRVPALAQLRELVRSAAGGSHVAA
jgi:flagellum-specific ATP synthase